MNTSNLNKTIKNLDLVLGIKPLTYEQTPRIPKQPPTAKKQQNNYSFPISDQGYFKFAELVNGRCATLGLVMGKVNYTMTESNMYTQLTTDPVQNIMLLLAITMVMSSVTLVTFDKRNEENVLEEFEQVILYLGMTSWLINLTIMLSIH
jgi:hypothetical protein